jgi:hypothetical protein
MSVPTPPVTGAPLTAAPKRTGNRWLGITALVYGAAVAVVEMITLFNLDALFTEGNDAIVWAIVSVPALLFVGIVLCIVAGAVAPKWRKLAVIGGILLAFPLIYWIGSIVFFAVTGSGLPS